MFRRLRRSTRFRQQSRRPRRILQTALVIIAGVIAGLLLATALTYALDGLRAPRQPYREKRRHELKTGPKGGRYYETKSGRKVYVSEKVQ